MSGTGEQYPSDLTDEQSPTVCSPPPACPAYGTSRTPGTPALNLGARGAHTDLEHITTDGSLLVRMATVPPTVIVAVPCAYPGALLGAGGMAGLADSLRTMLTTLEAPPPNR